MRKKELKWHIDVTDRNLANAIATLESLLSRTDALESAFDRLDVVQQQMHETKCTSCALKLQEKGYRP
jgi:hypothetical protein